MYLPCAVFHSTVTRGIPNLKSFVFPLLRDVTVSVQDCAHTDVIYRRRSHPASSLPCANRRVDLVGRVRLESATARHDRSPSFTSRLTHPFESFPLSLSRDDSLLYRGAHCEAT